MADTLKVQICLQKIVYRSHWNMTEMRDILERRK